MGIRKMFFIFSGWSILLLLLYVAANICLRKRWNDNNQNMVHEGDQNDCHDKKDESDCGQLESHVMRRNMSNEPSKEVEMKLMDDGHVF